MIAVFTQRDASQEEPGQGDLYAVGTLTQVHKIFPLPDGSYRLFVEGVRRIALDRLIAVEPCHRAAVHAADEVEADGDRMEIDALVQNLRTSFEQIVSVSPHLSDDMRALVNKIVEPGRVGDFIAAGLRTITTEDQQSLLEALNVRDRLAQLNRLLAKEIEVLELRSKIQSQVQSEMGKSQREYLLREQMKAIRKELGESDDQAKEVEELREKIEQVGMPEAVQKEALRELDRLSKMPVAAAEYTVSRTYLDWLVSLPWNVRTEESIDLARTKETLDRGHSGLEKAKDRIVEYLAVRKLKADVKGPILCFVGPPGVGKTSLAKGIAESLGREVVRVSLGGMRDEAEIRGHRRTYIGALPGQVIRGLRRAETRNPVFVLDEIDKIGMDFRGDPAAALLEVLDPEQNHTFRDHYLDVPFDLSEVLCSSRRRTSSIRSRRRCSTAWKCSSCRATPRMRRSPLQPSTWLPVRWRTTASRRIRSRSRNRRSGCSSVTTPGKRASGTWSASWRHSAERWRVVTRRGTHRRWKCSQCWWPTCSALRSSRTRKSRNGRSVQASRPAWRGPRPAGTYSLSRRSGCLVGAGSS